jgi:hypothetical protein
MSDIIIRYALREELDAIVSLVREVCKDADIWTGYPQEEMKEEFSYCFFEYEEDEAHYNFMTPKCIVAEYKNELIGMMTFRQSYMSGYIFDLGWCMVKPKYQHTMMGVGFKLAKYIIGYIESIRSNGIIQVAARDTKLLTKLGFADSGLSVNEWGVELKVLHMKFGL